MFISNDCRLRYSRRTLLFSPALRGTSGLEVKLSDRPVSKSDVENPFPERARSLGGSSESEHSDEEQGFVSSLVATRRRQQQQQQQPGRRVRWGDLPTHAGDTEESGVRRENENCSDGAKVSGPISDSGSVHETSDLLQQVALSHTPPAPGETPLESSHTISQVGLSKKTAAGLRNLLKSHGKGGVGAPAVTLGLLEALTRTLTEWRTEETMR